MTDAIRPYRPDDLRRLREICVLTGSAGGDATGRWSTDELLPDLFLEPYVTASPDWAWVLDEGDGPIGYIVAVPDTRAFVRWWRTGWSPWFAERYAAPDEPYSAEEELVQRGYDPSVLIIDELDEYPAHLHIDLLPETRGRGLGRALVETLVTSLARAHVPGVHLTMDPANESARAFYAAVGFEDLPSSVPESSPVLGRWISPRG